MNIIDKKFNSLINELNVLSKKEIFSMIKENYKNLNVELKKSLENYFASYPYWGSLQEKTEDFEHLELITDALKYHLQDYIYLYRHLKDYRSKQILLAILNNYYRYDFETLKIVSNNPFPHYFDFDLIPFAKDEVFVDLGAFTGDTILDYIHSFGLTSYKKIYAYEMTPKIYEKMKENLSYYQNIEYKNMAVLNQEKIVFIEENKESMSANSVGKKGKRIKAVQLDDDIKEKITILKMDIEGSEQEALLGCENHIKEDHPTLMISLYHNLEDLYKIPKMIHQMDPCYQFYLRYYGGNIYPTEVVLIAIYPKET